MVYTTSDYFPFLARQFHCETGWDESNSYATFCRASKAILDFTIPYGLSVSTGRGVGSNLSSQLVFSMVPSSASSIGYLAASRPLFAISPAVSSNEPYQTSTAPSAKAPAFSDQSKSDIISNPRADAADLKLARRYQLQDELNAQNLLQNIRTGIWKCRWGPTDYSKNDQLQSYAGEYMAVAQLYPSLATMTGSYMVRRSATSELTISGVSVAGAQADLQLIVQHALNQRRWSSEATFGTNGKLFGLRGQYNFGDVASLDAAAREYYEAGNAGIHRKACDKAQGRLSVGSEVYFGAQEASGGVSVGLRYRYDHPLLSELTCVLNPLMGHLSLAWTQQLRPQMYAATRYDFNAFSLSSELAVGVEWQLDQNSLVKARWSDSQGLRCLVDTRLNNMVFSMGLDIAGGTSSGTAQPSEAGIRRFVRSLGLQFQWFL
ncbi:Mitochondrial distribution and morphology protein 10 [Coemansia sp. RSA 1250]|nr:Mitochondrial distribution and morphology protein 10 [Coemansia sp. RSA 1250]